MKTGKKRTSSVNVVTLGCSKNIFDSEVLMGQLKASNVSVGHEEDSYGADTVVINTCGFIGDAKQESIDTILDWVDAKKNGDVEKVIVMGCLSERYADDLKGEIPEVDSWFGTKELPRLLKTLKADYKKELVGERLLTTPTHYAYFKISEGCDRTCSFCAIPIMRGMNVSTPIAELKKQARRLAANGTKELLLIAQDLTYYGIDLNGKRQLADLLRELSEVEGIEWIRLHYAYPSAFPKDVLDVMQEKSNICNYLDMPLQHISNRMLKSMRRMITKEKTISLVEEIRERIPNIGLRTTLIAGYPGETEEDFQEMYDWVAETKFDRLGIFAYSHEENTSAFNLEDDVPDEVKKERVDKIMELQSGISHEKNKSKIGHTLRVLIDRIESGFYVGRTEYDSPEVDNEVWVTMDDEHYLSIGDFADVQITDAEPYDLFGVVAR
ncbi:30S ribosomal protein S12 methylthiotransferase RimO [bacterium SCSIO 12643]|nr:30S ribosomal protein S12 methylthiotransferase RimO [bacterium SCSIO 12643]